MNTVKEIERINLRELELGVEVGKGSWHDQYKDSAYVFVGGLDYEMTEGDVITVMSQFGEVIDINMPRDKETGKPKGFAFVMYEDQNSTVLAVDNMNGGQVLGRTIRVDHCRSYKQSGTKDADGKYQEPEEPTYNAMPPTLSGSESSDDDSAADSLDEDDPMAAFLRAEKKKASGKAKGKGKEKSKEKSKKLKGAIDEEEKKRARENETKEERKARRDAKKARIAEKEREKGKGKGRERDRDVDLDKRRSDDRGSRRDYDREKSPRVGRSEDRDTRRIQSRYDDDDSGGGSVGRRERDRGTRDRDFVDERDRRRSGYANDKGTDDSNREKDRRRYPEDERRRNGSGNGYGHGNGSGRRYGEGEGYGGRRDDERRHDDRRERR